MQLDAVLFREGPVCEHVLLSGIHAGTELGPSGAELVGDVTPGLGGGGMIGLEEDLPDRGGNDGVLAFRHVGQRVAHEMDAAALPGGTEDAGDGALQALVGVGDTSFTPLRPRRTRSRRKVDQKGSASLGPMCKPMISRLPSVLTATAIMAATLTMRPPFADLEVGGVEPEIGPFADERALQEGVHPFVDVLAQLRHARLGDGLLPV